MKGKMMKGRAKRATGGVNQAAEDLGRKNLRYTYQSNVNDAAEERKRGGKTMKKHAGKVEGKKAAMHAGRKPRKSGGRASSSDQNPFTSARKGTPPPGRTLDGSLD